MVALTMYAMLYGIAHPVLEYYGGEIVTSPLQFIFLVLSFVFLAAAGYVINDYFDRKADLVNRPDTIVVGIHIKRRWAMVFHTVFNIIGVILGFAVAFSIGKWWFGFLFIAFSLILWWYSSNLKKLPVAGNLTVAILGAVVPLTIAGFQYYGTIRVLGILPVNISIAMKEIFDISVGFAVFAFMFNFIRELVKDMEDIEGDKAMYCKTIPIVLGIRLTKYLASLLCFAGVFLVLLSYVAYIRNLSYMTNDFISIWYVPVLVALPLFYCGIRLIFSEKKSDYKMISNILKLNMLTGILYTLVMFLIIISNTVK
ncbi:MAG: geranylgeranylglycerol-phosphate geranylgeranyltransferase [Bacteroidales bacterium]|nr:geranylgeranylglycerol-phosphate geranylgeranyltransferase [Bacteroidales bacterium]HOY40034.1 geranylgeranylglycerol-phosphate geranylgeranyltransferase [Bacteroidales bacterium]